MQVIKKTNMTVVITDTAIGVGYEGKFYEQNISDLGIPMHWPVEVIQAIAVEQNARIFQPYEPHFTAEPVPLP